MSPSALTAQTHTPPSLPARLPAQSLAGAVRAAPMQLQPAGRLLAPCTGNPTAALPRLQYHHTHPAHWHGGRRDPASPNPPQVPHLSGPKLQAPVVMLKRAAKPMPRRAGACAGLRTLIALKNPARARLAGAVLSAPLPFPALVAFRFRHPLPCSQHRLGSPPLDHGPTAAVKSRGRSIYTPRTHATSSTHALAHTYTSRPGDEAQSTHTPPCECIALVAHHLVKRSPCHAAAHACPVHVCPVHDPCPGGSAQRGRQHACPFIGSSSRCDFTPRPPRGRPLGAPHPGCPGAARWQRLRVPTAESDCLFARPPPP